jgi:hypothetical protein
VEAIQHLKIEAWEQSHLFILLSTVQPPLYAFSQCFHTRTSGDCAHSEQKGKETIKRKKTGQAPSRRLDTLEFSGTQRESQQLKRQVRPFTPDKKNSHPPMTE